MIYHSVLEVRHVVGEWTEVYNTRRARRGLGGKTPAAYAKIYPTQSIRTRMAVAHERNYHHCAWISPPLFDNDMASPELSHRVDQKHGPDRVARAADGQATRYSRGATVASAGLAPFGIVQKSSVSR